MAPDGPPAPPRPHPPKRETFDVARAVNVDPRGVPRPVPLFRETPWGLYMSRPAPGRVDFDHLRSWLLPDLDLRVTRFRYTPGHERDQDYYVDLGCYLRPTTPGGVWTGIDHYLDLSITTGRATEVLDVDELLAATAHGLLDTATAERTWRSALTAVDGIAAHRHDLPAWLATTGHHLTWD